MGSLEAIINPIKGRRSPALGKTALMVSTQKDLTFIVKRLGLEKDDFHSLFMSRVYIAAKENTQLSIVGPFMGAPYAVALLEMLICWGVRRIIFLGWCGAVDKRVKIGDIVVPTSALSDEGTSRHYGRKDGAVTRPDQTLTRQIRKRLSSLEIDFYKGPVWTTDAIFRETRKSVYAYQEKGVLAVEMEAAALFQAAHFNDVDMGAVLVVSDEVSSLVWRQGFSSAKFNAARRQVCEIVGHAGSIFESRL